MSKIAENKALEAYPIKEEWVGNQYGGLEDTNSLSREKYQQGYNQAMQDFLEKAVKWLDDNQRTYREYDESGFYHKENQHLIEDFKNYIENEIQNQENRRDC